MFVHCAILAVVGRVEAAACTGAKLTGVAAPPATAPCCRCMFVLHADFWRCTLLLLLLLQQCNVVGQFIDCLPQLIDKSDVAWSHQGAGLRHGCSMWQKLWWSLQWHSLLCWLVLRQLPGSGLVLLRCQLLSINGVLLLLLLRSSLGGLLQLS